MLAKSLVGGRGGVAGPPVGAGTVAGRGFAIIVGRGAGAGTAGGEKELCESIVALDLAMIIVCRLVEL